MPRRRIKDKDLPPRVYLHHGGYRFIPYDLETKRNGKPVPLGKSKSEAIRRWADLVGEQSSSNGTLNWLWERYKREEIPRKASASQRSNRQQASKIIAVFGAMQISDLRQHHAIEYLDRRGKKSPIQANREIALLRHMLTKAAHWGLIDRNPLLGLQYRNKEKPRDRYVTDGELRAALRLARPWLRYLMWIGYLTGLRRGDLLSLTRFHCKKEGIEVQEKKTGRKAMIIWTPELRSAVNRALKASPDNRLFPVTEYAADKAWGKLQRKLQESGYPRFQMKDLRAKHATDFEEAGGNATAQLGHSQRGVTTRHYLRKPRIVVPIGGR